jgi:predicted Holliday junction resolvase-like endonuclease
MSKITFLIPTLIVIFLAACFYLLAATSTLNNSLKGLKAQKENELNVTLDREKELIKKELEAKYKADTDSYEAMAKMLEAEKQKARELREESD